MPITSVNRIAKSALQELKARRFEGAKEEELVTTADSFLAKVGSEAARKDDGASAYFSSSVLFVSRGQMDHEETRMKCLSGALSTLAGGMTGPAGLALVKLGREVLGDVPRQASESEQEAAIELMRGVQRDGNLTDNQRGVASKSLKAIDELDLAAGSKPTILSSAFRALDSGFDQHPAIFAQNLAAEILPISARDANNIISLGWSRA